PEARDQEEPEGPAAPRALPAGPLQDLLPARLPLAGHEVRSGRPAPGRLRRPSPGVSTDRRPFDSMAPRPRHPGGRRSMRRLTTPIVAAVLMTVALPTGASAETRIQQLDYVFAPNPAVVQLGATATWKNQEEQNHTTTDQSALALWDSGLMWFN